MSGCMPHLMQDITTYPQPVTLLFLYDLLRYMGPTIVKPVLCLELDPWVRVLGQFLARTTLPGGGAPLLPSLYKTLSPWCDVRRGRLDSMGYTSTPCIRNFSGKASHPVPMPS